MAIHVRSANRGDLPVLKRMIRENIDYLNAIDEPEEVSPSTIDRVEGLAFESDPLCTILVAEFEGQLAGYVLFFVGVDMDEVAPAYHINDLFVREVFHRKGVGRALMDTVREMAGSRGAARIFWTVWRKNPGAIAFYRSLGAESWNEELPMVWSTKA
ncbi:MAG TPA: GNAT family N-acetyltransferase [Dongiaceae bacterium]|jgi:GNAT superfamily N-acetyltransferase